MLSKKKMKKVLSIVLIICLFSGLIFTNSGIKNIYGKADDFSLTTNKKNIKVEIKSVSKKQIKLRFINKGNENFAFTESFTLKKRVNNKWKKVKWKKDVLISLTKIAWRKDKTIVKVKWKRFLGHNLSKGKYKLKYVKTVRFRIK